MQGYFSAAWNDIKNSPGWFGKLLLLGLVSLIPVFGAIVVAGYLYGWARDMAWGVHSPLPEHIFGNEDGRLYSRGFFVLVIGLACSLLPWVVDIIGSVLTGGSFGLWAGWGYRSGFMSLPLGMASSLVGLVFFVLSIAASLFAVFFFWVGSMRMSIYGRLSAGFQFGKVWSMLRHDFNGIVRILGMAVLMGIAVTVVASIITFLVVFVCMAVGVAVTGGNLNINASRPDAAIVSMVFAIGGVAVVLAVLAGFASMVMAMFVMAMVTRALGYWTRQFDVPAWRGQDDPMPFELAGGAYRSGYPPNQQPPMR